MHHVSSVRFVHTCAGATTLRCKMVQDPTMHVLIVGAGITGLLVAQGLKKEGIPFTIFESEASAAVYRPREWGMSIQWGLQLLKDCLPEERYNRIHTAAVDPYFEPPDPGVMPTRNGATGELLKDIPLLRMYRVSRRRMRSLCAEDIDVQYGKSINDVKYNDSNSTVTAVFEDGTEATGTLLVGADGAQSQVRNLIFGPEKAKALRVPYYAINTAVAYNDAEKAKYIRAAHPIMHHGIHPDGLWLFIAIQEVPDPDDARTWLFQLQCTWKMGKEEEEVTSLPNLKAKAESFGEPFKSAFLWIPEGTKLYENKISYWVPEPWDNKGGKIVLLGDAGHPMTFQRGQGLNHGIADAASLVKNLSAASRGENTVQEAVDSYSTEMIDRAGEETRLSVINTEMLHDWDRVLQSPILQRGGHPREAKTTT